MGTRRQARIIAMNILYSIDICNLSSNEAIQNYFNFEQKKKIDIENIRNFINQIIDGVIKNLYLIDQELSIVMKNWEISRLTNIDKIILRIATFEILFTKETPINVIINEAIEISKEFSTENSSKFINGILDKIKNKRIN